MTLDRPPRSRPMTPEEVLDGVRDLYARAAGLSWEAAAAEIEFETALGDILAVEGFDSDTIELYFGTGSLTEEWYRRVWEFGTVRGLCFALAQFVEVPSIEPVVVAGRPCWAAGAFLTIREVLANAGVDVSELRPSTPLLPYVWVRPDVFEWELPRLAPGRVPVVRFENRRLSRRILGAVVGFGGLLLSVWIGRGFPVVGGLMAGAFVKLFLLDLVRAPWAARRRNWSVEFGGLYDFRDLAAAIAGEPGRRAVAA